MYIVTQHRFGTIYCVLQENDNILGKFWFQSGFPSMHINLNVSINKLSKPVI